MSFRKHGVMSPRRRIATWASAAVAAAAVSASLAAGLVPASARASSAIPIPAAAIARLDAYALAFARQSGDAIPASVVAVRATQQTALKAVSPDNTVPRGNSLPVYLVVMKGTFKIRFPVPQGSHEPTGSYLSVMLSPTFQLIDVGLSNHAPASSLRLLGTVSKLAR